MPLGIKKNRLEAALSKAWEWYAYNFSNGELIVAVPSETFNVANPTAKRDRTYRTYTYYGILGHKTQFNQDGTPVNSISLTDTKTLEFVIPIKNLGGLTFEEFESLMRKPGSTVTANGEAVKVTRIVNDTLVKNVVITFNRTEGSIK